MIEVEESKFEEYKELLTKNGLKVFTEKEEYLPNLEVGDYFRLGPKVCQIIQLDYNGTMVFKQIGMIVKKKV